MVGKEVDRVEGARGDGLANGPDAGLSASFRSAQISVANPG
jgi:hypothetical protein